MDGLSGAASIFAILQLSDKVVKYINSAAGATRDRTQLRDRVRACSYILLQLSDKADDSEEAEAWSATIEALARPGAPLHRLYGALSLVAVKLQTKDNITRALKWPFQEKDVRKLIELIEQEKSLLNLALGNSAGRLLHEMKARSKENSQQLVELTRLVAKGSHDNESSFQEVNNRLFTIHATQSGMFTGIHDLYERQNDHEATQSRRFILEWLTPVDYPSQQQDAIIKRQEEQTIENILAGLLKQLAEGQTPLPKSVRDLYDQHGKGQRRPSLMAISKVYNLTYLLSTIIELQQQCKINLLATSRFIPEITKSFDGTQTLEIRASNDDVRIYLQGHMLRLPKFVQRNTKLQEDIKQRIVDSVDGMFLLAHLHFDSLVGKKTAKAVRTALETFITGSGAYDSAYRAAMQRIEGQVTDQEELAKQALAWITCARRPLSTLELQEALGVEIGELELDPETSQILETLSQHVLG
ncbi:uncharacterized protein K460DRAFT_404787 [Cucurbitaria berberidis CBS 394.84]|uniref:GPI inositol-deacylase winged helix domain-containing protein n=1 Tax=Cucurbitaria berberidis CBS 394.84 TaxID=1168544 RepID=A0A9P4L738_9PLEO|nr:uncharacterized protein K460DRAFT_404787 [Cucurbitaria berberidis CBS 394.84]KAF1844490.1 hypothetical protein K460DRAFT_404787 [Cucurbitaria berberidis CBS 394.84]